MAGIPGKLKFAVVGGAMLVLAGCSAQYRNHGYVPPQEELANIVVGVDSRDSIAESIGTPTTSGVLNDSGYYYVRSKVRHYAYRAPEEIEREVVAITFDKRGVVRNIERFGLQDGRVVVLDRRVTSSSIADKSFIRQLLGNIGRFTASDFVE